MGWEAEPARGRRGRARRVDALKEAQQEQVKLLTYYGELLGQRRDAARALLLLLRVLGRGHGVVERVGPALGRELQVDHALALRSLAPPPVTPSNTALHRGRKLRAYGQAPFRKNVFLDTDTLVTSPNVALLFDALDEFDLAAAFDHHLTDHPGGSSAGCQTLDRQGTGQCAAQVRVEHTG